MHHAFDLASLGGGVLRHALGVVLAIGIATPASGAAGDAVKHQAPREATQLASLRDGAAGHAVLDELIRLDLDDVRLTRALDEAAAQAGVRIAYASDVIPSDARVSLRADRITLRAALVQMLDGTGLDVLVSRSGNLFVVRRSDGDDGGQNGSAAARAQAGTITGTVTEIGTQRPLPTVQIVVERTGLGTFTDREGRFRIDDVPAGSHQLTARAGARLADRRRPGRRRRSRVPTAVISLHALQIRKRRRSARGARAPGSSDAAGPRQTSQPVQRRIASSSPK